MDAGSAPPLVGRPPPGRPPAPVMDRLHRARARARAVATSLRRAGRSPHAAGRPIRAGERRPAVLSPPAPAGADRHKRRRVGPSPAVHNSVRRFGRCTRLALRSRGRIQDDSAHGRSRSLRIRSHPQAAWSRSTRTLPGLVVANAHFARPRSTASAPALKERRRRGAPQGRVPSPQPIRLDRTSRPQCWSARQRPRGYRPQSIRVAAAEVRSRCTPPPCWPDDPSRTCPPMRRSQAVRAIQLASRASAHTQSVHHHHTRCDL